MKKALLLRLGFGKPQRKGEGMERDYKLDKEVYFETIWYIRQYPELKAKYDSCFWHSGNMDGQPKGTQIGSPTERDASLRVYLGSKLAPIEHGRDKLPIEYQTGVFRNIVYREPFPDYADTATWKRWKRRFVYFVAKERERQ